MNLNEKLRLIFHFHPKIFREAIKEEAKFSRIENYAKFTIYTGLAGAAIMSGLIYVLPYSDLLKIVTVLFIAPGSYFIVPFLTISIAAERRRKEIERVLPNALRLMSTNIKSGASIDKALIASARPEFGPLEEEFRRTAVEISGGKAVNEAIENLRGRVNSELLRDTLKVLMDARAAGGNTAALLESSAEDIRKSLELRREVESSIRTYVIFILIASTLGAPLLFSMTTYMSETTAQMWDQVNVGQAGGFGSGGGGTGISISKPDINADFLVQFSIAALIISNSFSGLIISQIRNGNVKEGAKYIPFTVAISVTLYIITKNLLGGVLG